MANSFTMRNEKESKQKLEAAYKHRHSPMRTQLFVVRMYAIPSFVSVHLVRHSAVGQQHYVGSNRVDLGGDPVADRYTPVDHMMVLNAQHLEEMAWDRLCKKSSPETRKVMQHIAEQTLLVDPDLANKMVPRCVYLGRCDEYKPCGRL